jgi:hypothetical protein
VERVVLNALAKESGFYGLMFAPSAIISASSSEKPIHLWLKGVERVVLNALAKESGFAA